MSKPIFDSNELVSMLEQASAQQAAQVRETVRNATLQALQSRELNLRNIRSAVAAVADSASAGLGRNAAADPASATALLDSAIAGMDEAMLKAVEANRTALAQLSAMGGDFREKVLKKAVSDLEKMEDSFFDALSKTGASAGGSLGQAWTQAVERVQGAGGTKFGNQAETAVASLMDQTRTAMRETRAASVKAATAMAGSYALLASGVLMGLSEAMRQGGSAPAGRKPR